MAATRAHAGCRQSIRAKRIKSPINWAGLIKRFNRLCRLPCIDIKLSQQAIKRIGFKCRLVRADGFPPIRDIFDRAIQYAPCEALGLARLR